MTGFARVRKPFAQGEVVFSLKSVNHRGLDLHFHMPNELDPMENEIRSTVKSGVARGHVQIHVAISRTAPGGTGQLNRAQFEMYLAAFREAAEQYKIAGALDLNHAMRIPGMIGMGVETELDDDLKRAVLEAAGEAVVLLNQVREREGAATSQELRQRGQAICGLVTRMEEIRAGAVQEDAHRALAAVAEHRVGEHGFARQVLADEVGGASHSSVHGFDIDAARRERRSAIVGLRGIENDRLAAARHSHFPFLREPLRAEIQRLNTDVAHAQRLELPCQPRGVLRIGGCSDDASPEFRMTLIAVPPGDHRLFLDQPVKVSAVDPAVRLFARW
jgi:uncharacterized protein YicC (UPF0701 family)